MIFSFDETDTVTLAEEIKVLIVTKFSLDIPVFVISQSALRDLLQKAPDWWGSGNKDIYDNLIFAIPP